MNQDRYSRQVLLKEIGIDGQRKLSEASAVVMGCGALGTHSSSLLARAGVGEVTILDRDVVDITNLQRQTLFGEDAVGQPKAEVAERQLRQVNSEIAIRGVVVDVTPENVEGLLSGADVVVDATDNMKARFVINDACVKLGVPWVYGGAVGTSGMVLAVHPEGPCLRCVFPTLPPREATPTCDEVGIVNTLPSVVASIEVTEALKVLLGERTTPELMIVDVWSGDLDKIRVAKNKSCVTCARHEFYRFDG
ncbi:MAG: HesA/MoeB/ThiF family protein [Methanobacteriota archaeon]|nr:MAG: HesA/MoeB/ThiF family protein [Euryarchaeota archaeon]